MTKSSSMILAGDAVAVIFFSQLHLPTALSPIKGERGHHRCGLPERLRVSERRVRSAPRTSATPCQRLITDKECGANRGVRSERSILSRAGRAHPLPSEGSSIYGECVSWCSGVDPQAGCGE